MKRTRYSYLFLSVAIILNIVLICMVLRTRTYERRMLLAEFKQKEYIHSDTTLVLPDGSQEKYIAYNYFDFEELKPKSGVSGPTFVYVHESLGRKTIRLSDDFDCPYVITRIGSYWSCEWGSPLRGDSIGFKRFINDGNVYDYFQFHRGDSLATILYESRRTLCKEYHFIAGQPMPDYQDITLPELLKLRDVTFGEIPHYGHEVDTTYQSGARYMTHWMWSDKGLNEDFATARKLSIGSCQAKTLKHNNTPVGIYDLNRDLRRPYFLRLHK